MIGKFEGTGKFVRITWLIELLEFGLHEFNCIYISHNIPFR